MVVPLSLTEADRDVLRYAGLVARLGVSREFHFVHVLAQQGLRPEDRECVNAIDRVAWQVDEYFRDYPENLQVTCEVRGGLRLDRLLEFMRDRGAYSMLVGTGRSESDQSSTAVQLALSGRCSVWAVPPKFSGQIARILAPVDFSEPTCESLSLAALLGRLSGLDDCLALPVGDHQSWPVAVDGGTALQQFLRGVNTHGLSIVPVSAAGGDQPISQAIVNCARRYSADLIVLGLSQSRAETERISSSVLSQSTVPVLLVRPTVTPRELAPVISEQDQLGQEKSSPASSTVS
jgi:nucleotide-binding universal stress UspA family protein